MELSTIPAYWLASLACLAATFLLLRPSTGSPFAAVSAAGGLLGFLVVGHPAFPIMTAMFAAAVALLARRGRQFEAIDGRSASLEFLGVGVGLLLYTTARRFIESDFPPARAHALQILSFERSLGLGVEARVQDMFTTTDLVTRGFNTVYSFYFLPLIAMSLLWLYISNRSLYRVVRTSLAISVLLALAAIAVYPVAPPRLVPEANVVDTVVALGREHAFANEYAAVPSLHVGWTALAGYALSLTLAGWRRHLVRWAPGSGTMLVVIVTGNHYWVDGIIGVVFSVTPAIAIQQRARLRAGLAVGAHGMARTGRAVNEVAAGIGDIITASAKALFTAITLGALLAFLLIGQLVSPGFTAFWGYLVVQMAATLAMLVLGEWLFREQGGLSWPTHIIAVVTGYADTLGTAGDLYANIAQYDKFTHFAGIAAVTAGCYDVLRALGLRGARSPLIERRLVLAVGLGVAVGVGWEVYEFLGDKVFATKRVQGRMDTTWDLVFDTFGALVAGFVLQRLQWRSREEAPGWARPETTRAER